jgi:predicted N-acetyltransferase YhbS
VPERPAIRPAAPEDLARLGPVYERSGFGARLAGVVSFAKARLEGEVVVAEAGGELVGVAAGAAFGATGWVGGVAVVPAQRRAGLGGALTGAIVESLEASGVATVLLHATALGRPVYERLGFVAEAAYLTLAGPTGPRTAPGPPVRAGRAADLAAVLALDLAATGGGC